MYYLVIRNSHLRIQNLDLFKIYEPIVISCSTCVCTEYIVLGKYTINYQRICQSAGGQDLIIQLISDNDSITLRQFFENVNELLNFINAVSELFRAGVCWAGVFMYVLKFNSITKLRQIINMLKNANIDDEYIQAIGMYIDNYIVFEGDWTGVSINKLTANEIEFLGIKQILGDVI